MQNGPPKPRAHATLLANPNDTNTLLLFGGEYFNGTRADFFNDLHIYNIAKDEWRCITSPNTPLPRSGHAWCRAGNPNYVYLFGGEFSSPKQGTFHHYSDFWRLEPATREWTRIEVKGNCPPARSGHRMTYWKQYIILFGGFQDTSNQTKYLADLWIFDTQHFVWYAPVLPSAQLKPDARSSFTLLPHEQGAVLYGGYSRVKTTVVANKQAKGSAKGQRNVVKPMVHQDCFFLRMSLPEENSPAKTPPLVRWERRKRPANGPNPVRAGATMAFHKGRGIMFGGVHDVEMSEEDIDSEFFNALFAWNVERNRFMPLTLRKPRVQKKAGASEQRVGRRGRAQANEEELLRQLAALETGKSLEDLDSIEIEKNPEEVPDDGGAAAKEMPVTMEPPHARFNAQLAVQDDVLYIYGGTFEKGDREFTFDDLYAIDLVKLSGCKQIFSIEHEDWVVSFFFFLYPCSLTHWLLPIYYNGTDLPYHRSQRTKMMMKMVRKTRMMKKKTRMVMWAWAMQMPPLCLRLASVVRSQKMLRVRQRQKRHQPLRRTRRIGTRPKAVPRLTTVYRILG